MAPSSVPPEERRPAVARVRRAVARAADHEGVLLPKERILVACSGGPDSLTLLDALCRLAPPRGWTVLCAHVDHGLRSGSEGEGILVGAECERLGVEFRELRLAGVPTGSIQAWAREARYAALTECADGANCTAIATGHTADDQAETVLMRALAGATPASLAAMRPRRGRLARPLLGVWRADTLEYCGCVGMTPLTDPSNADPRFLRSRIRHQLMPALEEVFPAARRRLVALAKYQQESLDAAGSRDSPC